MDIGEFFSLSDNEKSTRLLTVDEDSEYLKDKVAVIRVTEEDNDGHITQYIPGIYRKFSSAMKFIKKAYPEAKPVNWFTTDILEYEYDKPQEFDDPIHLHVYIEVSYHFFHDE